MFVGAPEGLPVAGWSVRVPTSVRDAALIYRLLTLMFLICATQLVAEPAAPAVVLLLQQVAFRLARLPTAELDAADGVSLQPDEPVDHLQLDLVEDAEHVADAWDRDLQHEVEGVLNPEEGLYWAWHTEEKR
jgi:hypothetical protein